MMKFLELLEHKLAGHYKGAVMKLNVNCNSGSHCISKYN